MAAECLRSPQSVAKYTKIIRSIKEMELENRGGGSKMAAPVGRNVIHSLNKGGIKGDRNSNS